MIHVEYLPDAALRQDIKRIWYMEETPTNYNQNDILPDAYTELVVNCGAPVMLVRDDGSEVELPDIFINHIQAQPIRFRATGTCQIIALRLYPWAHPKSSTLLTGTSFMLLDERWSQFARSVRHTFHTSGHIAALDALQKYFIEQVGMSTSPALLRAAGQIVFDAHGLLQLNDLATQTYFSVSQIERVFKQHLGMSPKLFSRLVRFRAVCSSLMTDPNQSATDLAQQFGYTDQAHFSHDMKSIARRTPGELAAQMNVMRSRRDAENLQYG